MSEHKARESQTITPHSTIIPPITEKLPVKQHQKVMIDAIRQALGIADIVSDESINYQLSWCKWMVQNGHNSAYANINIVKDHIRHQYVSDEGIANAIRAAEQGKM